MRKLILAAAAAAAALALTACGGPTATSAEVDSLVSEATAPTTPAESGTAKFGATYTWTDGLQVTVGKPAKFKLSEVGEMVLGEAKGTPVKMQVVVKNGTKKPIDLGLFYVSAQSKEAESEAVFDSEAGIDGSPSTKLLPGKSVKFYVAFDVLDPKDMVVEVSPNDDFSRDEVLYSS